MSQPRPLVYHGSARGYDNGRDEDYSPPNESLRAGRKGEKARKRNSVACARCRKRKIKCTGDLHDGNGCEACQTAGSSPDACFYLRVNSHQLNDVSLQSPSEPDWPSSVPTTTTFASSAPRITSDPSQYALANANMLPHPTAAPYPGQANSRAPTFNDMSSVQYAATPPRQSFPSNYENSIDNQLQQFDIQQSRHGYPVQMAQAPTSGFPNLDQSHHWTALSANNRQLYSNLGFDQDTTSSFGLSLYPYPGTACTTLPAVATEGSSIFPGLSSLGTHLPSRGINRILPTPTALQNSFDSSSASPQDSDGGVSLLQQDRSGDSWDLSRINTGTSQGSASSVAQDSAPASGPPSSDASSSPSETANYGYIPMTHSTTSERGASTSGFPSILSATMASNPESYSGVTTSGAQSNLLLNNELPGNNGLPSLNSSFGFYGVNGSVAISDHLASEGQVAGGQPAPRILQPQPRHSTPYDLLRGSFDTNPQRTSRVLKSNGKRH